MQALVSPLKRYLGGSGKATIIRLQAQEAVVRGPGRNPRLHQHLSLQEFASCRHALSGRQEGDPSAQVVLIPLVKVRDYGGVQVPTVPAK